MKYLLRKLAKSLIRLAILTFLANVIHGKPVDEQTARQTASMFYRNTSGVQTDVSTNSFSLAYKSYDNQGKTDNSQSATECNYYYVFNAGDSSGFVIVSGDDKVTPILGYSTEGKYVNKTLPPNFKDWMEGYRQQIEYVIKNNIQADESIRAKWNSILNGKKEQDNVQSSVLLLVKTKWDQSPYYNDLCPYDNLYYERAVTGCVATAMAQIMKYWNYPEKGTGLKSYNHSSYGKLSANFGATTYQWNSMPNSVTSSNSAVATLMYHCGVSVEMDYGVEGSGAYVFASGVSASAETALKTYFGYKSTLYGVLRSGYTETEWINKLKTELDAGRPVLYRGRNTDGGHAFVADGYNSKNYFHFNWGWSGSYDGYFYINTLNPGGIDGLNNAQGAIFGIEPNIAVKVDPLDVAESVEKSSLPGVYPNPANDVLKVVTFKSKSIDKIKVYDFTGRLVLQESYSGFDNQATLNVSVLVPGSYIVFVESGASVEKKRLFINRE